MKIAVRVLLLLFVLGAAAVCADNGNLRVGAARVEFTKLMPAPDTPPTGKYEHEKLFARAIVLDNGAAKAALISFDGNAPATARAKVADLLKCPVENVIISGTHSHSAGTAGRLPSQANTPLPPLDDVVLDAVRQAAAKLQPARMTFGTGLCYLNVNRDTINPKTRL